MAVSKKIEGGARNRKAFTELLLILGFLIFVISGWLWWHFLRSQPENVYWGMVDNALRTSSITRQANEENESQKTRQYGQIATAVPKFVRGGTDISQTSEGGSIRVKTDTIGTPFNDYVKYNAIESNEIGADGKPQDFSKVINVWGKSDNPKGGQTNGQLYSQAVLGVIPFGNLTKSQRTQLLTFMKEKKVYDTDFKSATRSKSGSRPRYTYEVSVNPEPYIRVLKDYAAMVGLTQLKDVNPEEYRDTAALRFKITVDVFTKQIVSLQPVGATRTENFSAIGALPGKLQVPSDTISIAELQEKLQNVR